MHVQSVACASRKNSKHRETAERAVSGRALHILSICWALRVSSTARWLTKSLRRFRGITARRSAASPMGIGRCGLDSVQGFAACSPQSERRGRPRDGQVAGRWQTGIWCAIALFHNAQGKPSGHARASLPGSCRRHSANRQGCPTAKRCAHGPAQRYAKGHRSGQGLREVERYCWRDSSGSGNRSQ